MSTLEGGVSGLRNPEGGGVFEFDGRVGTWTLGSQSNCDFVVDDVRVSRHHCIIQRKSDGSFLVHDNGSTNGTAVDGKPITKATKLSVGSSLRIGDTVLVAVSDAGAVRTAQATKSEQGSIGTLLELRRYLREELQGELELLDHLGNNEQRFQHFIVTALERRISRDHFRIEEKWKIPDTDQFADVVIHHAHEDTAVEIKPDGQLEKLRADAAKLRGYLRRKKARVTFGVLIYRSPREPPPQLLRDMRADGLHLIRVRPTKARR